ncbi:hypothetical protein AsGV126 [Agrotis segetum granulovirus]|uniref:Uncharacterized protein n=1 Tax=Agrotis segetum granulosis virus TaxID=10464 RepID=A0A023MIF1_GVAS|nr:hypothetical protein AsGV126 [Agrotis segetum granulovirus]AHN92162.1 hypothetical protein AsGV123 [Agrotis segetum granulovirus]AKN63400.1 hypothetical protein AsGV126 [Agrotis segetum granulovirus]
MESLLITHKAVKAPRRPKNNNNNKHLQHLQQQQHPHFFSSSSNNPSSSRISVILSKQLSQQNPIFSVYNMVCDR